MKRCVIVGGAGIENYKLIREKLRSDDFVIYCDSGLKHMEGLGAAPGLALGDFDSHERPAFDVETIVLPREKDDTDTLFAVKEAVRRGFDEFLLVGVIGARLDHTLANVYILEYLDRLGKKAEIVDDYSDIEMVSEEPVSVGEEYEFFSLLNVTGLAEGVDISGAKYELKDAIIDCGFQYAVSNEVVPGKTAAVSVKRGKLLLIKDRRKAAE